MGEPAPPGAADAVVRCRNLSKRFVAARRRVQALKEVTVVAHAGRITGLIGPDGAGKTTLMRLVTGLLVPDAGTLEVLGLDVRREPVRVQESVGYMPQRFGLYEDLTVQENLDLYADLHGVSAAQRVPRYAELLHMTGLGPFTGRLAGRLSGGMKQKLGLACTLVHPPRLLLLDEPTVGVDPVSRRELWRIVYREVEQEGMSVLLSTAYLDEAERCHEVILMHEGQVLGVGTPADITAPMAGRSFLVKVPATGVNKRHLQAILARAPGVVDALIQGDDVRLVMAEGIEPDPARLWSGGPQLQIEPVAPRFEDAFVARLRAFAPTTQAKTGGEPREPPPATHDPGEAVITVDNATRVFGTFRAVKGISFTVRRGEIFGLLGANGAGKTTTFRMLCGLLPASGGELRVAGHDLRHAAAQARARIGYMAQRFSLYVHLTVGENLAFYSAAYGLSGARRRARIHWALDAFELEPVVDTPAQDLPLGYLQRLAMAAALMHEPEILFLDEPTSGVDPLARRAFWARINALAESGVSVLVTTHFMDEANYCDRLVIMAAGEILAEDTPEALKARFRSPEHPNPSMEDVFITLIQGHEQAAA